jgi:hypothetical protein
MRSLWKYRLVALKSLRPLKKKVNWRPAGMTDARLIAGRLSHPSRRLRIQTTARNCARKVLVEKPAQVLGKEIVARTELIPSIFRRSLTPDTDKAAHRAMTNPDGTHEVNGRTKGSPSADDRVALRKSV